MRSKLARYMVNLEHFATVVEYGNISTAASVMAISQPALTRSVLRLEEVLGVQLLLRTHRGVVPTESGQALLGHIASAKAELDKALTSVQIIRGGIEGKINCGAGSVSMIRILPYAVSRIRQKYKKIQVNLIEGRTQDMLTRLRSGELDVVIGIEQPDSHLADLHSEQLIQEHFGFYVRQGHPDSGRASWTFSDIMKHEKFVMPSLASSPVEKALHQALQVHGCVLSEHRVESLSLAAMRHLVLSEDYIAFSSTLLFDNEIRARSVQALQGDWSFPSFATCLYRPRGDVHAPIMRYFIDEVKLAARD